MDLNYEKRLELEIDRELKGLPDVPAPATLGRRVMAAIESARTVPWYRRSWEFWPRPAQVVTLGTMLLFFGALCFELWQLERYAAVSRVGHEVGGWLAWAGAVWNAAKTVLAALVLVVRNFGTWILLAGFSALALAWGMFLGLGTICFRIAFVRR